MEKVKIGEQIRLLRRKNDVTQDQLAGYLGVTPQAVSRWESGVCYPDMGYLPAIADFFSVSMDELLCYADRRTEGRVRDCISQVDALLEKDRIQDALEMLREAMAEVPSSCALRLETAEVLSQYAEMVAEKTAGNDSARETARAAIGAALGEAVSLCRRILEDCNEDNLRDRTKRTLCDIYAHQLDDGVQAMEIAEQFHDMAFCREIIKATVLTGEVAFRQAQENLILFADNIWWHLYNLACVPDISGNRYTLDERLTLLRTGVEVFRLVFGDQPLFYADRLANSCRQMALLYMEKGDPDAALEQIERMADYAVAYDERPAESVYTATLINRVAYVRADDDTARHTNPAVGKCARMLPHLTGSRAFATLQQQPRFRDAVARMADCAAHSAVLDGTQYRNPKTTNKEA